PRSPCAYIGLALNLAFSLSPPVQAEVRPSPTQSNHVLCVPSRQLPGFSRFNTDLRGLCVLLFKFIYGKNPVHPVYPVQAEVRPSPTQSNLVAEQFQPSVTSVCSCKMPYVPV